MGACSLEIVFNNFQNYFVGYISLVMILSILHGLMWLRVKTFHNNNNNIHMSINMFVMLISRANGLEESDFIL